MSGNPGIVPSRQASNSQIPDQTPFDNCDSLFFEPQKWSG